MIFHIIHQFPECIFMIVIFQSGRLKGVSIIIACEKIAKNLLHRSHEQNKWNLRCCHHDSYKYWTISELKPSNNAFLNQNLILSLVQKPISFWKQIIWQHEVQAMERKHVVKFSSFITTKHHVIVKILKPMCFKIKSYKHSF